MRAASGDASSLKRSKGKKNMKEQEEIFVFASCGHEMRTSATEAIAEIETHLCADCFKAMLDELICEALKNAPMLSREGVVQGDLDRAAIRRAQTIRQNYRAVFYFERMHPFEEATTREYLDALAFLRVCEEPAFWLRYRGLAALQAVIAESRLIASER